MKSVYAEEQPSFTELSDDRIHSPESSSRPVVEAAMPLRSVLGGLENGQHRPQARELREQLIAALRKNGKTNRLELQQKFLQLLNDSYALKEVLIVSICGPRYSGKSFLLDAILSQSEGQTLRVFCKAPNEGCNVQLRQFSNSAGRPILLLDWQGFQKQPDSLEEDAFLLLYMISSVVIYNQLGYDQRSQENFLRLCSRTRQKVITDEMEYSFPQLVLTRRDIRPDNVRKDNLAVQLNQLEMFQPYISQVFVPYPGTAKIVAKELMDVPRVALEPQFFKKLAEVQEVLRQAQPRYINDSVVSSNILAILCSSYVSSINRNHRLIVEKWYGIYLFSWEEVIETLSVGAYNYYILQYSEALSREFSDQRPLDRYSLYKKLNRIKNETAFKQNESYFRLQNFANVRGNPIFEKYRLKLAEFIRLKEQMITEINRVKSVHQNQLLAQTVKQRQLKKGFEPQNLAPIRNIFVEVAQGSLEDGRKEALQASFADVLVNHIKPLQASANTDTLQSDMQQIGSRIQQAKRQLDASEKRASAIQSDLSRRSESIQESRLGLAKKQKELEEVRQQIVEKTAEMKKIASQQSAALQLQRQQIEEQYEQKLQQQKSEIARLSVQLREQQKKSKLQAVPQTQQPPADALTAQQERQLRQLRQSVPTKETKTAENKVQIDRLKALKAAPPEKKGCCSLI